MEYYRSTGGFTCSAAGAGKEQTVPSTGHWAAIWVTAYAADSSGVWQTGEPGHPYLQNAASAVMGPVVLQPGQPMVTQISGATANVDTTIEYRGWFSDVGDGSDLTGIIGTEITSGSITLPTPVPVSDGGLAGSVAQKLSQFSILATAALPSNTATVISTGVGTANPYPMNAASWQLVISGLQGTNFGCRVTWQKQDGAGNTLGYDQRDSAVVTMDRIIGSGILDAPTMIFTITLPSGAPAGCTAILYTTALLIQDNWYDAGIYENASSQSGLFTPGPDGILATISNSINAGTSQSYQLPTYRGPCQLGIEFTQAGHAAIQENTYLGGGISGRTSIPVSTSGLAQQIFIVFVGAYSNVLNVFNDSASNATVIFEMRAIKDRLD